jgi:hypothetical protein
VSGAGENKTVVVVMHERNRGHTIKGRESFPSWYVLFDTALPDHLFSLL